LDLLAEILLTESKIAYNDSYGREDKIEIAGGENYFPNPATYFSKIIDKSLNDAKAALESSYKKTGKYPYSLDELKSTLKANGIEFDALHDPWDMPYEAAFLAARNQDVVELKSAGPDKLMFMGLSGVTNDIVADSKSRDTARARRRDVDAMGAVRMRRAMGPMQRPAHRIWR